MAAASFKRTGGWRLPKITLAVFAALACMFFAAHKASAATLPLPPATATSLTASPSTVTAGDSVTLTAIVQSAAGTPPGSVEFDTNTSSGKQLIGTATLDSTGTATLVSPGWTAGTYSILASYQGDQFDRAVGATQTMVVTGGVSSVVSTVTTITATPNPANAGGSVTFTAKV